MHVYVRFGILRGFRHLLSLGMYLCEEECDSTGSNSAPKLHRVKRGQAPPWATDPSTATLPNLFCLWLCHLKTEVTSHQVTWMPSEAPFTIPFPSLHMFSGTTTYTWPMGSYHLHRSNPTSRILGLECKVLVVFPWTASGVPTWPPCLHPEQLPFHPPWGCLHKTFMMKSEVYLPMLATQGSPHWQGWYRKNFSNLTLVCVLQAPTKLFPSLLHPHAWS
jgi:hypothetical protein